MRKSLFLFIFVVGCVLISMPASVGIPTKRIDVIVFHSETCGTCSSLVEFLNEMAAQYPTMVIHKFSIFEEETTGLYDLFGQVYDLNVQGRPIPVVYIGNDSFMGYSPTVRQLIEKKLKGCFETGGCTITLNEAQDFIFILDPTPTPEVSTVFVLPFLLLAGIICSLNPYLSHIVSRLQGGKSALFFTGFFVTSFVLCFVLANILFVLQMRVLVQLPLIVIAIILGVLSILSFIKPVLRIPSSALTAMDDLIRDGRGYSLFTLGIGTSLISLLYTAGIYLLIAYNVLALSLMDKVYDFLIFNVTMLAVALLLYAVLKGKVTALYLVVGAGSILMGVIFWVI